MSGFGQLLGTAHTKQRLIRAIVGGTLPHAILLCGPRGSGKKTLAALIASAMNCEQRAVAPNNLPCGECNACKRIKSGNFPDVKYLERADGKATVGAAELREFREDMFLSATEANSKFYIIPEAELLTPAAQNALLKVLEEPPPSVYIILLTTDVGKMLSTIRSRTQYVQMELFSPETLSKHVCLLSVRSKNNGGEYLLVSPLKSVRTVGKQADVL